MKRLALIGVLVAACSHSHDGPVPSVDSVEPMRVCVAQGPQTIHIHGSGFSPEVDGALTASPTVVMPVVALSSTAVPPEDVSVPDDTGTQLDVSLPQAFVMPGTYDVGVTNPDGHADVLAGGLVIAPPPDITAIDPNTGLPNTTVNFTVTGTDFEPMMTITLESTPPVQAQNVVVAADGTSATGAFDLTGVAAGTYDVTVANPSGCSDTLPQSFTVGHEIGVIGIDPPFGYTGANTVVTITGDGEFVSTPKVELKLHDGTGPTVDLERVAYLGLDATTGHDTLTAVVPMGTPVSPQGVDYDVIVINPPSDGGVGILPSAFREVSMPIPTIEAIVPARGSSQADVPVTIYGDNFRTTAKVELLDATLTAVGTVDNITPTSATQIDTTLPTMTSAIPDGAYLVRVTDNDQGTYSTFSAFIVGSSGPSGNLHTNGSGTFDVLSQQLNHGRRELAGVSARDDLGNTYLYAIGGDDGTDATANAAARDDYEVSQLSKFGAIGAWSVGGNLMAHARAGAAAIAVPVFDPTGSQFVPVKSYIYVIGGRDGDATTNSVRGDVERAEVLRNADAPANVAASAATGGNLANGTWYYKVTAILDPNDPDNPSGETLASDEAITTLSGSDGTVHLTWDAVTVNGVAATSYRIYRTDAANGVSQEEHLIDTSNTNSYDDNGKAAGTVSPPANGSLGVWVTQTQALATARWGTAGTLVEGTSPNRFLVVVGGLSGFTTGFLGDVEVAPIDASGQITGAFSTTGTSAMTPRAFFSLAVETAANVSGFTGFARLFTLGGVDATGISTTFTNNFQFADVNGDGTTTTWSHYTGAGQPINGGGRMAVITGQKLFIVGGANTATVATWTWGGILSSGDDVPFNNSGAIGSPVNSSAGSLAAPRALGTSVVGSGFIYFIGGTSTGTNAVNTVERTF